MTRVLRRVAQAVMWASLAVYVAALAGHPDDGFHPLVDGWLCAGSQFAAVLVAWLSLGRATGRRREVAWLAGGMTAFATGNAILVHSLAAGRSLPVPSWASVGYLAFYPAAIVALALAVLRRHRSASGTVVLDSLVGALAAASLIALLLGPAFATSDGGALASAVSLAFPLFDLVFVVVIVAVAGLERLRLPWPWHALLVGFAIFTVADIVYDRRIASGTYAVGTVLDALWGLGLAVMTLWTEHPAVPVARRPGERPTALVVPGLATAVALGVLMVGSATRIPVEAVVLAALTVVATAGRTTLAFRQERRLADLRRQASTDDLTGLPNRRAFFDRTAAVLRTAPTAALFILDLDKFKEVNDALGHQVGDQLLVEVGARLSHQLRDGDLLARLGGDEYAVLVTGVDGDQAVAIARKLRSALAAPFRLTDVTVVVDASVGIALHPRHGDDLHLLMRRADIAMYKAKRGREGQRIYRPADDGTGNRRLRTLEELREGLAEGQVCLHYQPQVDLSSGTVPRVEALVRWQHPSRGLLYPDSFLGFVEEAGLMPALTAVVLETALDQAAAWHSADRALAVAVNLSASSLVDDELPAQVQRVLAARALAPETLQLEITEESLMSDRERAADILRRLRDSGVQISVDDFGTGYSSLSYLRELPISELKLDRSFVFPMSDDRRAAALVTSTIGLAHSLGLRMIAEGVEDAIAVAELARNGCDLAQGFYFSRPVPARQLEAWLDERLAASAG